MCEEQDGKKLLSKQGQVCLQEQTLHPRVMWSNRRRRVCSCKLWLVSPYQDSVKGLKATPSHGSLFRKTHAFSFYRSKIDLGQN